MNKTFLMACLFLLSACATQQGTEHTVSSLRSISSHVHEFQGASLLILRDQKGVILQQVPVDATGRFVLNLPEPQSNGWTSTFVFPSLPACEYTGTVAPEGNQLLPVWPVLQATPPVVLEGLALPKALALVYSSQKANYSGHLSCSSDKRTPVNLVLFKGWNLVSIQPGPEGPVVTAQTNWPEQGHWIKNPSLPVPGAQQPSRPQ